MSFTAHQIVLGDEVMVVGMDKKCSLYGVEEKCTSGFGIET
jgi:hypothetical protein